ncbi:MAG: hypothetical protein ACE5MK_13160 [Acidobacteriota bacterium]
MRPSFWTTSLYRIFHNVPNPLDLNHGAIWAVFETVKHPFSKSELSDEIRKKD